MRFRCRASGGRCASIALLAPLCAFLALVSPACGPSPGPRSSAGTPPTVVGKTTWESCYVHHEKIGYIAATVRSFNEGRRELLEITSDSQIGIRRFGDRSQIDVKTTSIESTLGEVRSFSCTTETGGEPVTVRGTVAGGVLEIETQAGSKIQKQQLPWDSETKGFQGVEQSLEREPMRPGEVRRLKLLLPLGNQVLVADATLTARDYEPTKLLDRTEPLLHIDFHLALGAAKGASLDSVIWMDSAGESLKTFIPGIEQETFRTTREQALEAPKGMELDLKFDMVVKTDRALPAPSTIRRARYRVTLDGGDPFPLFAETSNQHVTQIDPHTIEIAVTAPDYSPDAPQSTAAGDAPPTSDDAAPNNMIQSDDPTIVGLAVEAQGDARTPLEIARALEAFVERTVTNKNFTQAFATALDVADSHEGDCTEHSVLLAALARALKMPARVVTGLVYFPPSKGFAYHMWTEIYDGRNWLPWDATLGRGGIGAGYIELGTSNLKDASGFASLISVVQILGRLKIEVLDFES